MILSLNLENFFDWLNRFANNNIWLILAIAIFLAFLEAILPFLPLVAIVAFNVTMVSAIYPQSGFFIGVLLSVIGSFIGTYCVFMFLRTIVDSAFRKKIEKSEKVKKACQWLEKRSMFTIILFMSNPYTPASIFNYAFSITNYPKKKYLLITFISRIICVIILSLFGVIFKIDKNPIAIIWVFVSYIIIYLIIVFNKKIIKKIRSKKMKKTIKDVNLQGKTVLIRVDFNVPMKDGVITDENRIVGALPTINYALEQGSKVVLLSHLGRIKEESDKVKNTLAPVAKRLSEILNKDVKFVPATRGEEVEKAIKEMKVGDIVMLENTRFEDLDGKKESKNDPELGKYWASLGEVFVNDAFGTAHRAHASNVGIASNLKDAVAGFLVEKEIKFIGGAVDNPARPFVAILGGAKVSDKISVIENLLTKADKILICGAMAYTFYKALGYEVGTSKCEDDFVEFAKGLLEKANGKIILPVDTVVAKEFAADAESHVVASSAIPADEMGMDVGPETLKVFAKELKGAKTVVWNGPAGVFEFDKFAKGTNGICEELANLEGAITIIGGGDSAAAAIKLGYESKFTHISTGGGASLEYLEGKELPGVAILNDKCCCGK